MLRRNYNLDDSVKIKCRGRFLKARPVNESSTLMSANLSNSIIFFSMDEPIAILYKDRKKIGIMDFRSYGEITVRNKTKLRESNNYKTVLNKAFEGELFKVLSHNESIMRI